MMHDDDYPLPMAKGRILEIWTAPTSGAPMEAQATVHALPGKGLDGDRYCNADGSWSRGQNKPDQEVTLIELEQLAWFERETGTTLTAEQSRRNILTEGIELNPLVGRRFFIGDVEVEGMRLCEPCKTLQERTGLNVLPDMIGRSGLNCRIITDGMIHCGDTVG
jgi:MOSC domain-containing protein YiiM